MKRAPLQFIHNLTIKQKMFIGFGVILVILAIIAVKSLTSMLAIKDATSQVVEKQQMAVYTSLNLSRKLEKSLSGLGFFLLSKDHTFKDQYEEHLKVSKKILMELKQIDAITSDAQSASMVAKIENHFDEFLSYQDTVLSASLNNDENFPGMRYSTQKINPISQTILQNVGIILGSEQDRMEGEPDMNLLLRAAEMRYAWTRLMNGIRAYLGFRNTTALDEIKNYSEYFKQLVQDVTNNYNDHLTLEQEAAIDEILNASTLFEERINQMLSIHGSDQWRTDAYLIRDKIGPILARLSFSLNNLISRQTDIIRDTSANLIEDAENTSILIISMLLVAMVSVIILAYLLMTGIIRPMTRIVDHGVMSLHSIMESINDDNQQLDVIRNADSDDAIDNVSKTFEVLTSALQETISREKAVMDNLKHKVNLILSVVTKAAKGDLTGRIENIDTSNNAEDIDLLARDTQKMVDNLNTLVSQVQNAGIRVNSSATDIAATAKQQEATVTEQAASTREIMATVTEISATSKDLVHTMESIQDTAENTAQSATSGQSSLRRMEEAMRTMRKSTDTIASKLSILNEKASTINTVVTTINRVADQTNLLSLNAAIEAEKAGEYGKGFAVVATEIRRLADQTAVATWDIEQMVKEMQSAVSAGVMGMDKFSDDVSQGVNEIAQIGGQLGTIIDEVQNLTPRFETVTEGMQSQAQGGEQISESMIQLNETAHQTADSLRQSSQSIQKLKEAANGLQEAVSIFKVHKNVV